MNNIFASKRTLRDYGFTGFVAVRDLVEQFKRRNITISGEALVPSKPGIYIAWWPHKHSPKILERSEALLRQGGLTPTEKTDKLECKLVSNSQVLYIGKVGKAGDENRALKTRIQEYLKSGNKIESRARVGNHSGGRYIWQIENSDEIEFCWKPIIDRDSREIEKYLIELYMQCYSGKKPFANIKS